MNTFSRKFLLPFLSLGTLLTISQQAVAKPIPPMEARIVSERYGFSQIENCEQIKFTFVVDKESQRIERQWIWNRTTESVRLNTTEADGTKLVHTLERSKPKDSWTDTDSRVDRWFINDRYWVMFPFHLNWDDNVTIIARSNDISPYSGAPAHHIVVNYSNAPSVGYTPGDNYELFVSSSGLIESWRFTKAGATKPNWVVSWDRHVQVGPLTFSTLHENKEKTFRIEIRDLAIKLKNDPAWIHAPASLER